MIWGLRRDSQREKLTGSFVVLHNEDGGRCGWWYTLNHRLPPWKAETLPKHLIPYEGGKCKINDHPKALTTMDQEAILRARENTCSLFSCQEERGWGRRRARPNSRLIWASPLRREPIPPNAPFYLPHCKHPIM